MMKQLHCRRIGSRFPSVGMRKVVEHLSSLISKAVTKRTGDDVASIRLHRGQAARSLGVGGRTVRAVMTALENVGVIVRIGRGMFAVAYSADGQTFTPFNIVKDMLPRLSTLAGGSSAQQARDLMTRLWVLPKGILRSRPLLDRLR